MYISLPPAQLPAGAKPGTPAPVNPDSLAAVLAGETGMSAYRKYDYGWEFRPPLRTGMGCAGDDCKCGGKCGGLGQVQDTSVLGSISLASWLAVGLAGAALWWVMKQDKRSGIYEVPIKQPVKVKPLKRRAVA
jgi:hypothetical protein